MLGVCDSREIRRGVPDQQVALLQRPRLFRLAALPCGEPWTLADCEDCAGNSLECGACGSQHLPMFCEPGFGHTVPQKLSLAVPWEEKRT